MCSDNDQESLKNQELPNRDNPEVTTLLQQGKYRTEKNVTKRIKMIKTLTGGSGGGEVREKRATLLLVRKCALMEYQIVV